jgi:hypothetical protein
MCFFFFCVLNSFKCLLQCWLSGHENCFSSCLSWKIFIFLLILKDNFSGCSNLAWYLFTLKARNTSFHDFLDFRFLLRGLMHFWCICVVPFNILSLLCTLGNLCIIWYGEDLFWSCLFGVINASYTLGFQNIFLDFWKFSAILSLHILSIPSVSVVIPYSSPKIYIFDVLIMS